MQSLRRRTPTLKARTPVACRPTSESLECRRLLASVVWDGGADGSGTDWHDPVNWSGNVLPTAADTAIIDTPGPSIVISLNASVASVTSSRPLTQQSGEFSMAQPSFVDTYHFSGGIVTGSGNLTIHSALNWSAGTFAGSGRTILAAGSVSSITPGFQTLDRTLDNHGTINDSGNAVYFGYLSATPGVINNLAGGTYNSTATGGFYLWSFVAGHAFNNAGTFNKSGAGTATIFSNVAFNNTASVQVDEGSLGISDGISSGSFDVAGGAELNLGGTRTQTAGSITGPGTINLAGTFEFAAGTFTPSGLVTQQFGTTTFVGPVTLSNLNFLGGTITGGGNLTINSALNWSAGTFAGSGRTILAAGSVSSITPGFQTLDRTLDNHGTINDSGNAVYFGYLSATPGVINNLAGATYNSTGTGGFYLWSFVAGHAFNNAGTFNKTGAGTATSFSNVAFNNTASVQVDEGSLGISNGTSSGTFDLAAGTTLDMYGTRTHTAGSISGPGTTNLSGTLDVVATLTVTNFHFSNGLLTGNGNLIVTSALNWTAGTFAGAGRTILIATSVNSFGGFGLKSLERIIDNFGTIDDSSNAIYFGFFDVAAGTLNNLSGGTYNSTAGGGFYQNFAASHAFNNGGTFTKSGAVTSTFFSGVSFNNTGNVQVNEGSLAIGDGTSSGTLNVAAGATLDIFGIRTHTAGSLTGAGGINLGGTVEFAGGTFAPSGLVSQLSGATDFAGAVALDRLDFISGTIAGSGDLTIMSALNWSGGTFAGDGKTILASTSVNRFEGFNIKSLDRTLENSGTIDDTANAIYFGFLSATPGALNNLAGGTYNSTSNGGFFLWSFAAPHAFNNAGAFNKSGVGTNTTFGGVAFNSSGGSLTVTQATLSLSLQPPSTLVFQSLSIDQASIFHTANHSIIVDHTGDAPIASFISAVTEGRLTFSDSFQSLPTTLAISEAADLGLADFNGIPIDDTATLLKYTYVGDANLDGQVDALDYERIDLAIGNTGVLGTAQGDLNYDGNVDALDYEQIDLNIGNGVGSPLAGVLASTTSLPESSATEALFSRKKISPTDELW